MEAIVVALLTGGLSLVGVIITNMMSNSKIEKQLEINQAVTDTKLESLTDEVKKHNNFAMEIPVIKAQLSEIDKRISKLESR